MPRGPLPDPHEPWPTGQLVGEQNGYIRRAFVGYHCHSWTPFVRQRVCLTRYAKEAVVGKTRRAQENQIESARREQQKEGYDSLVDAA
jgi:hypothetical protein